MNVDYKAQTRFLLQPTEKVLAKDGLPCRQFQRKTEPEQKFFPFANIRKNAKGKIFCGSC